MDAKHYSGAPGREHDPGRTDGTPEPYVCLGCPWKGKGSIARSEHVTQTGHLVIWGGDPRAKDRRLTRKAG